MSGLEAKNAYPARQRSRTGGVRCRGACRPPPFPFRIPPINRNRIETAII